jgi:hypothetical protein
MRYKVERDGRMFEAVIEGRQSGRWIGEVLRESCAWQPTDINCGIYISSMFSCQTLSILESIEKGL